MIVNVREIPEEGQLLEGEITRDIFQLDEKNVAPAGPVHYALEVSIVSDSLLVQGSVSTTFRMECVRCLEEFIQKVDVPEFVVSLPLEGEATVDLTDAIREDILLALPIHPHCENGTPPRECPFYQRQEKSGVREAEDEASTEGTGQDVWAALKDFKARDSESSAEPPESSESH